MTKICKLCKSVFETDCNQDYCTPKCSLVGRRASNLKWANSMSGKLAALRREIKKLQAVNAPPDPYWMELLG